MASPPPSNLRVDVSMPLFVDGARLGTERRNPHLPATTPLSTLTMEQRRHHPLDDALLNISALYGDTNDDDTQGASNAEPLLRSQPSPAPLPPSTPLQEEKSVFQEGPLAAARSLFPALWPGQFLKRRFSAEEPPSSSNNANANTNSPSTVDPPVSTPSSSSSHQHEGDGDIIVLRGDSVPSLWPMMFTGKRIVPPPSTSTATTTTTTTTNRAAGPLFPATPDPIRKPTPTTIGMSSLSLPSSTSDQQQQQPSSSRMLQRTPSFRECDLEEYEVQRGESFESIALKHDMTTVELRRANPGVAPPAFQGQMIRVKRKNAEPTPLTSSTLSTTTTTAISSTTTTASSTTTTSNPSPPSPAEALGKVSSAAISREQLAKLDAEDLIMPAGMERPVRLCVGEVARVAGSLFIEVNSGFIWFHPEEQHEFPSGEASMEFSLDRNDILGCTSVNLSSPTNGRGAAAASGGGFANASSSVSSSSPSLSPSIQPYLPSASSYHPNKPLGETSYFQIVWRNDVLGFTQDQQLFFEVSVDDISALVDAVYSIKPKERQRTMTYGISALRALSNVTVLPPARNQESGEGGEDPEWEDLPPNALTANSDAGGNSKEEEACLRVPPTFRPRESRIVAPEIAMEIARELPPRLRDSAWRLLYDFDEAGVSLHAFYAAARGHDETVLLCRNLDTGELSGIFANETWEIGQRQFFGTGECFVFAAPGRPIHHHAAGQKRGSMEVVLEEEEDETLDERPPRQRRSISKDSTAEANEDELESKPSGFHVHHWSGANERILSCSTTHLGVGGGGNFALCVDEDLKNATSGPCTTFLGLENQPLTSSQSFPIGELELWALEPVFVSESPSLSASRPRVGTFTLLDSPNNLNNAGVATQPSVSTMSAATLPSNINNNNNAREGARSPTLASFHIATSPRLAAAFLSASAQASFDPLAPMNPPFSPMASRSELG